MVTRNTSRPRYPRLWRNASFADLWYDAVHSLLTRSLRSPRLGTSSGYPLDGRVSPADPPCFPCWVNRVPGSTSSLPWIKIRSMPPWLTNSGLIFMPRRSSSTSYSIFTYSPLAFHWRSTTRVGKLWRGDVQGNIQLFETNTRHGTGIGIRSIQPQRFPRIEEVSTAT